MSYANGVGGDLGKLKSWMCRTTPGEWLMEANQKTDRPPEQIVREVSTESHAMDGCER